MLSMILMTANLGYLLSRDLEFVFLLTLFHEIAAWQLEYTVSATQHW